MVDLGTTDTIYNSQNKTVEYTLPIISKNDNLFTNWESYRIIVWYDYTTAPANDYEWTQYSDGAQSSKVDVYQNHAIEYIEMVEVGLYYDQGALNYDDWKKGEYKKLTDAGTVQTIDYKFYDESHYGYGY